MIWLASVKRAVTNSEIPRLKMMKVLIAESEDICMQRRHGFKQCQGSFPTESMQICYVHISKSPVFIVAKQNQNSVIFRKKLL